LWIDQQMRNLEEPLSDPTPFRPAPIEPHEVPEALEYAARFGVLGVYVRNGLSTASLGVDVEAREIVLLHGTEELVGLVYFGGRGNLVLLCDPDTGEGAVARAMLEGPEWRIALGPERPLAQVSRRDLSPPIVFREQIYYSIDSAPAAQVVESADFHPRLAVRRDVDSLVRAALDLNQSDLRVAPWRVNRSWLKDSVRERIDEGRTWVVGEPGKPSTKLDLGSVGPAGSMIEGVYTFPEARGRGLATALVASVAAHELQIERRALVCLHVDAANRAARRAYEKAGMSVVASGHLLLRG
jgi:predicted GNAT family acetyltransferase